MVPEVPNFLPSPPKCLKRTLGFSQGYFHRQTTLEHLPECLFIICFRLGLSLSLELSFLLTLGDQPAPGSIVCTSQQGPCHLRSESSPINPRCLHFRTTENSPHMLEYLALSWWNWEPLSIIALLKRWEWALRFQKIPAIPSAFHAPCWCSEM